MHVKRKTFIRKEKGQINILGSMPKYVCARLWLSRLTGSVYFWQTESQKTRNKRHLLNENAFNRHIYLNTWFPVGRTASEELEGVLLGAVFEFSEDSHDSQSFSHLTTCFVVYRSRYELCCSTIFDSNPMKLQA